MFFDILEIFIPHMNNKIIYNNCKQFIKLMIEKENQLQENSVILLSL